VPLRSVWPLPAPMHNETRQRSGCGRAVENINCNFMTTGQGSRVPDLRLQSMIVGLRSDCQETFPSDPKDMSQHCGAAATDVLGHAYPGILDLVGTGYTGQLLHDLRDLIDASGADRMPPALQSTHGTEG
jgi:hypothetical protein